MDPSDWRIVRSTPLFGTVSQEVAQSLIGSQPVSVHRKGETLFQQGEPANSFFALRRHGPRDRRAHRIGVRDLSGPVARAPDTRGHPRRLTSRCLTRAM